MPTLVTMFILVILVGVLFGVLKVQAKQKAEIRLHLDQTGDAKALALCLQKKSLRALSTDAELDDAFVRLARMQEDKEAMAKALQKMNSHPTPIQLDYLWGIDRFFYALFVEDDADLMEAVAYTKAVMDSSTAKKKASMLDAMEAVSELVAPPEAGKIRREDLLAERVIKALCAADGMTQVESKWLVEGLEKRGIVLSDQNGAKALSIFTTPSEKDEEKAN